MKLVLADTRTPRRRFGGPTLATIAVIKLLVLLCLATVALLT